MEGTFEIREIDKAWFAITKFFKETGMKKSARNNHGGYNYRTIDQVMAAFSAILVEYNLNMKVDTVSVEVMSVHKKNPKSDNMMDMFIVEQHIKIWSLIDGSCEVIRHHGCGNAANNNDRALQGAVSDGWKYAIVRAFCIPTDGMPDEDSGQVAEELPEEKFFGREDLEALKPKIERKFKDNISADPVIISQNIEAYIQKQGYNIPQNIKKAISDLCVEYKAKHGDEIPE